MNKFRGLITAAVITGSCLMAPSAQAQSVEAPTAAGTLCNISDVWCGRVLNKGPVGIGIIKNWGESWSKILPVGWLSSFFVGYKDTDGFYIGSCYYAKDQWGNTYWPGNHKINDSQQVHVTAYRYC